METSESKAVPTPDQEQHKKDKKREKKDTSPVFIKAPITKFWEEEVEIQKGVGMVERSKQRFVEVTVSGLRAVS